MSRIVVLVPCLLTGGTEVATLESALALQSLGYLVEVIVYFDEVDAAMLQSFFGAGVRVHRLGVRRTAGWPGRLMFAGRLAWHLARGRYRLIWVQYMTPTLLPLALSRLFTRHLLACVHVAASHYSANGLRRLHWLAQHWCSRFVCVSETVARGIFGKETGAARAGGRVVVIPNSLDVAAVRAAVARDWRAEAGWPADALVIGFAGRLAHNKGADVLLDALAQLHGQGLPVRLVLVGDGAERAKLQAQAQRLCIAAITRFAGRLPRSSIYAAIKGYDIAVVPSREEGFGLSALEAMAAGVPVVASRVDALQEVVVDGATGLLCPADDPASLAEALARLMGDAALRQRMGAAGVAHVESSYDAPAFRAHLAGLLTGLGLPVHKRGVNTGIKTMNLHGTKKVIHIASSHKMGLTAQETELAIAYKDLNMFDLLVVTGENEQIAGNFDRLFEKNVKNKIIKGFDEHRDFIRLVQEFVYQCNVYSPNIVTLNTNWQLLVVGVARLFCKERFKIIYTIHGFRHNEKIKSYVALFLIGVLLKIFADVINAPTSYVAKKFGVLKGKMVSIPLGEDSIFFEESKSNKFGSTLNMIFAGQFRAGKNQDILIHALHDYIAQTGDKNVVLYLPGSGDLLPVAQRLADDLNIAKFIIFPGQLNRREMLDLYKTCQIAVVPANAETFGHCIAEPLVLQKIVISRPVGVAVDVIGHGLNGFIFETTNELIQVLKKIRNMDPEELGKISANAKKTGEMFRWENIARRHYQEVFSNLF